MSRGIAKVPVKLQLELRECGPCCLSMILGYYHKIVSLDELHDRCGLSRDGTSAKNLLIAARGYGLRCDGWRLDVEQLRQVKFPCIIQWRRDHFVVLCGFRGSKAVICDPARGVLNIGAAEFDRDYTGICLQFEPSETFVADGSASTFASFMKRKLRGMGESIAFAMVSSLLAGLISIVFPAASRVFVDQLLTRSSMNWARYFIIFMSVVIVVQFLLESVRTVYMLKVQSKLLAVSNSRFMWHVLRLPMSFFDGRFAGDIANRQKTDETVTMDLFNHYVSFVFSFGMLVIYLIIMTQLSLVLSLIAITALAVNIVLSCIINNRRLAAARMRSRNRSKLDETLLGGIELIETIKANGAENGYFARWAGYQAAVNTCETANGRMNAVLTSVPQLMQSLAQGAVLIIGALLIIRGQLTAGMLLAFQGYMTYFLTPVDSVLNFSGVLQNAKDSMSRLNDVSGYKTDVDYSEPLRSDEHVDKLLGALEVDNVTFGYSKLDKPVIKDFSMRLEQGKTVALVGTTGCGKSTVTKLISGLYEPWSGEIRFGGKRRDEVRHEVFTSSVAVVSQNITLFEDTISANLKMWDDSIEDFEVILAARDAQIHDDIMQRDGGYNAKVLENGKNFSGGQRQCLEIARVLAQDPTLIILDEATSAMDAMTEYQVVRAIRERGISCIIVAHRLSTVRECDEIIVLDKGSVVERGTHEQLLSANGLYSRLAATE